MINEYCSNVGEEYNPLREYNRYGETNPYQDLSRGRLNNVKSDRNTGAINDMQRNFLQNLSGIESITGRSLSVYKVTSHGKLVLQNCCVIARDASPQEDLYWKNKF